MKNDGLMEPDERVRRALLSNAEPVLMVRLIGPCGCRLGRVTKVGGENLLILTNVSTVAVGPTGENERRRQHQAFLLAEPGRPVYRSCKHEQGRLLPLDGIREPVAQVEAGALRRGYPVRVGHDW